MVAEKKWFMVNGQWLMGMGDGQWLMVNGR